ncbi:Na-translocating system protein MpsC family protein [Halocella sp. SP3-1]|uniref:DUF2294 domain-containing protein n=1 Tax=Halocella sp. SP3-1 TaxID=2382161 RepID=UPI000F750317|nr:Na-translocating system protein MpsC family protein [Halocella sp. SP3-1]AZO93281.1 DUF2294 family protein [Halocella sp. SP3-1]
MRFMEQAKEAKHNKSKMSTAEEKICNIFKNFEENYWGKKSHQIETYLIRDIIVLRSQGNLSPAEEQLARTEEGKVLIKQLKVKELSSIKNILKFHLENKLNLQVLSLVIDNNPELDETIIVCRLNKEL